jgi:hypothetical protein
MRCPTSKGDVSPVDLNPASKGTPTLLQGDLLFKGVEIPSVGYFENPA